jgi:hypothetical protein
MPSQLQVLETRYQEFHPEFTIYLILPVCKHKKMGGNRQSVVKIPNLGSAGARVRGQILGRAAGPVDPWARVGPGEIPLRTACALGEQAGPGGPARTGRSALQIFAAGACLGDNRYIDANHNRT